MRDFDDAVVVVTGSATGLGAALAIGAAEQGAKAVILNCTKSLARALAPKIRVNAICPGFIDTRWFSDAFGEEVTARIRANVIASVPLQAASTPEDIAASGLFFLSRASRHVTGETLLVDAGLHLGPNLSARAL